MNQTSWKSWWAVYSLASGPFALVLGMIAVFGTILLLSGYEDVGPIETRPLTVMEEFVRPATGLTYPLVWFCCMLVTKLRQERPGLVFVLNALPLAGFIWVYSQPPDYSPEVFPEDQHVILAIRNYLCIVLALLGIWYLHTRRSRTSFRLE